MSLKISNNTTPQLVKVPQWGTFATAISRDPAYTRVRQHTSDDAAVIRLEVFFIAEIQQWENIFGLWNIVIQSTPEEYRPSAEELATWQALAEGAEMPFKFIEQGFMKLI